MSLTSSATPDQIKTEYRTCCVYDVNNSPSLCARFIAACRYILGEITRGTKDGKSFEQSHPFIQRELDAALAWYSSNGPNAPTGGTSYVSFQDFRS